MTEPPSVSSGRDDHSAPTAPRSLTARVAGALTSPAFAGIVGRGAGMAGAFAMSVAILRSLPASDAGLVLLVYTLLTIAATLARFGTDNLALREVSKDPAAAGPFIRNAFLVVCALSVPATAMLVGAVLLQSTQEDTVTVALAAAAGVLPAALGIVAGAVLRGLGRVGAGTFAELGSPVLIAAVGIAALGLTGRATAVSAVATISLGYIVTALWSWWLIWRTGPALRTGRGSHGGTVAFFRDWRRSLTAFFTSTMGFYLFTWMPVLALGYFIETDAAAHAAVAVFNAAARISQFVILVPTMQISYLSHRFARLHHDGDLPAVNGIAQSATKAAVIWGAVLAGSMVVAPAVWLAIFGGYTEAAPTLRILAVGALVVAALGPVNGLMLTCGFERQAGRYTLVLLVLSAVVLPVLSRWGPGGVAWGSTASSLAYAVAAYATLSRAGIHAALPRRGRTPRSTLS